MSYSIVYPNATSAAITVNASDKIAVKTKGTAKVYDTLSNTNFPDRDRLLQTVENTEWVSSAFSSASTVVIEAESLEVHYSVGTSPHVLDDGPARSVSDTNALNATGTLTAEMLLDGIVTSTTAAAVTATLDTGAIMDGASEFTTGDYIFWSAINTGGANAFTVTASTGHTIVGSGTVAASSSASFATRKTAASTFVTYRLG